jgi:hypothetical protein
VRWSAPAPEGGVGRDAGVTFVSRSTSSSCTLVKLVALSSTANHRQPRHVAAHCETYLNRPVGGGEAFPEQPQRLVHVRQLARPIPLVDHQLAGGGFARPRVGAREGSFVGRTQLRDLHMVKDDEETNGVLVRRTMWRCTDYSEEAEGMEEVG